ASRSGGSWSARQGCRRGRAPRRGGAARERRPLPVHEAARREVLARAEAAAHRGDLGHRLRRRPADRGREPARAPHRGAPGLPASGSSGGAGEGQERRVTMKRILATLALAAVGAAPFPGASERDAYVAEVMREGGIPGLQVAVVKDGRLAWSKAFGYAVLANPGPARPMREDDLLYTCSIGKMITAVVAMQQ